MVDYSGVVNNIGLNIFQSHLLDVSGKMELLYFISISGTKKKFLKCFSPLKTEIRLEILHTEPFLCDIRGLRYLQNKVGCRNRQGHFRNDLMWS